MYKMSKADHAEIAAARGKYDPEPRWYAIMAHFGRERRVRDRILTEFGDREGLEVLLPEVREPRLLRHDQSLPARLLFSSYIFMRCRLDDEIYVTVHEYRDVFQIFGRAFRVPSAISDREMDRFREMLAFEMAPELSARKNTGEQVIIAQGCMKGTQGRLVSLTGTMARIETSFSFLSPGDSVVITLPREQVTLLTAGSALIEGGAPSSPLACFQ